MNDKKNDEFDDLLTIIGFGRWQIPSLIVMILIVTLWPSYLVGSSFLSAPVAFKCARVPLPNTVDITTNNISLNLEASYFDSTCLMSDDIEAVNVQPADVQPADITNISDVTNWHFTGMPSCPYVKYDTSIFTSTVFSQWHLVCERSGLRPLFQMMSSIGGLLGSLIGGDIGDRFGRKKAIFIGSVGTALASGIMASVPWYSVVLAMRITVGLMNQTAIIPAWSLVLERTPSRLRGIVGMLLGLPYSVCVMLLALNGYFIRTWQYILLLANSPVLILLPMTIFVDESPSWLIQAGRAKEAKNILEKAVKKNLGEISTTNAAKINRVTEPSLSSMDAISTEKESPSLLKAKYRIIQKYLRSTAMKNIFILTPALWFLQSCLYLSVAINANNFTSSGPFLYVALTGVMDGTAILLCTPLATRIGRKIVIFTGMFTGATLFLLALPIPQDQYWAKWVLVMTGFLTVGASFQVNFVYTPELFPTEIRARGFAFTNVMGSMGSICAPLVTDILAGYTWWAANTFFGCAGILGSLTVLSLPETRNKPLPETLQDVDDRRSKSKVKKRQKQEKVYNDKIINKESIKNLCASDDV